MKRILALVLMTILLVTHVAVCAEDVVILESPDLPVSSNNGTIDDLKVGIGVDLGDRIYTPMKIEIADRYNTNASYNHNNSGVENQYVLLWLEALNLSTKEMNFFHDAQVVLVYEGERGTYKFGGFVRQSYGDEPYWAAFKQDEMKTIGPLLKRNYLFGCKVPNFVEENPGEIRMEITTGTDTMTCFIRK